MINDTLFKNSSDKLRENGDSNFCGPMALSILANAEPIDVARTMEEAGLRMKGKGCPLPSILEHGRNLGLSFKNRTDEVLAAGGKSVISIVKIIDPTKKYLVGVRGHILAIVNGVVHDWTNDRKHRITNVYEIEEGKPGIIKIDLSFIKSDSLAGNLTEQVRNLVSGYDIAIVKSAAEVRVIFNPHGYDKCTCYIRKSRNGYTLQYSLNNAYSEIAPSNTIHGPRFTKQYANYEYPTLKEAVDEMCESAGFPHPH